MMRIHQEMTTGSWNIPSGRRQMILGCLFHREQDSVSRGIKKQKVKKLGGVGLTWATDTLQSGVLSQFCHIQLCHTNLGILPSSVSLSFFICEMGLISPVL